MKKLKFLKTGILALLLLWSTANAQDPRKGEQPAKATGEIPELQEWWRAPADIEGLGRSISFLPNFYNGKNAIAIQVSANMGEEPKFHTWLNRFPGDTQNVFTWKAGYIKSGDFNGDGITDYIDGTGNIYRGIQNGMPPENEPVKNYGMNGQIFDINGDGYDDVYNTTNFPVLYGGADLTKLVATYKGQHPPLGNSDVYSAFYKTPQGEFRAVVHKQKKDSVDGYILYRATWEKGSMTPQFEPLDSIIRLLDFQHTSYYDGISGVYQSKHHSKTYLFNNETVYEESSKKNAVFYDVTNDKFTESLRFKVDGAIQIQILNQSIDGDEYEDWTFRNKGFRYFLSGGITLDSIVRFKYKGDCWGGNLIETIGDVDKDGIGDMIISTDANGVPNCFRIVKGMAVIPDGISTNENKPVLFSLAEPVPNPLHTTGSVLAIISKSGNYTLSLYTVDGRNITRLFDNYLDIGTHILQFDLTPYNVSSGSYILRLSNGSQSIEKTIIITN